MSSGFCTAHTLIESMSHVVLCNGADSISHECVHCLKPIGVEIHTRPRNISYLPPNSNQIGSFFLIF